ncbi:MAG TPA: RDD family protein [Saprospiraceae bacterium]|nr:RDD family protein [Saprospiraceae bacterium]
MQSIEIKTTQNVTIEYELAALRDRILAFLVDLIIISFAYALLFLFFTAAFSRMANSSFGQIFLGLLPIAGFMIYQFMSELLSNGQSLGKKALNIRVVRLDGRQPSTTDYLIRAVFHIIDTVFSSGILAALVISTSVKRQRLGDMTANTTVIRTSSNLKFRLADILNIDSLEKYTPVYPEVAQLSDEDMLVIKSVIRRCLTYNNLAHREVVDELTKKLVRLLNIQQPPPDKVEFLKTLLRDYIVLTR